MRCIDRYLFREWLKVFLIAIAATVGILILEDMYKNFREFLREEATLKEFLRYYAILVPCVIPVVLPISFLISLLFTLGNFHRHNEITALRACGLSVFQITRVLWGVAALLVLILLGLDAYWVPKAVEQLATLHREIRYKKSKDSAHAFNVVNMTYDNSHNGRLWIFHHFNGKTQKGEGVLLHFLDANGNETRRISAQKAHYEEPKGYWVLENGQELSLENRDSEHLHAQSFEKRVFPALTENPSLMQLLRKPIKDLSFFELKILLKNAGNASSIGRSSMYWVRYYNILLAPLTCFFVIAIAIPFSIGSVRVNPLVGVSKACGLFFAFYILLNISRLLGEQAFLRPLLAAIIPHMAMLTFAVFLYHRQKLL